MTPDRLTLIESRWREAGCGDGDLAWLLEEVKRLRRHHWWLLKRSRLRVDQLRRGIAGWTTAVEHIKRLNAEVKRLSGPPAFLDEALNSGRGVYQP